MMTISVAQLIKIAIIQKFHNILNYINIRSYQVRESENIEYVVPGSHKSDLRQKC